MHNRIGRRFQRRLDVPVWLERGPQGEARDIELYDNKVLGYTPTIFWSIDDAAGPVAVDSSGNGLDGTYSNVVLGEEGIGDGKTSGLWVPASNPILNSPDISGVFDGDVFSLMTWVKARVATVWNTNNLNFIDWFTDGANNAETRVHPTNGHASINRMAAGGFQNADGDTGSPITWTCLIGVVDLGGGSANIYQDGVSLGSFVPANAYVGAENLLTVGNSAALTLDWDGNIAKAAIWFGTALTQPQAADLAVVI